MFIYERNGKLNIMVSGGRPAAEGITPDIVIEQAVDTETGDTIAKVSINGTQVVAGEYTLPVASDEVLGGVKVGTGLTISEGVLSVT